MNTLHRASIPVVLVALLSSLASPGCKKDETQDVKPTVTVRLQRLATGELVRRLTYIADIEGESEVRVFSTVPDRVVSLHIEEGDRVAAGDLLAMIRSRSLSEGVRQAVAGQDAVKAQLGSLRDQQARLRRLEGARGVTSAQLLAIDSQVAAAEAQARQLAAMTGLARDRYGDAMVRAPIAGIIGQVFVKVGDLAVPQMPLCTVVELDRVRVKARVPETDLPSLAAGQPVEVAVVVDPANPMRGTVTRVGPVLDRLSRSAVLEVELANPDHRLKPGMLARLVVEVERRAGIVIAPRDALAVTGETVDGEPLRRAVVAVKGKAVERKVRVGLVDGDQVEVKDGLAAGDELVVMGQHLLAEGDPLRVEKSAEAAAATPAASQDKP